MGWALLVAVAALVVFAALHDVRARRRGTYRPPEEWNEARRRRRSQWKHRGALRPPPPAAEPKDPDRQ